MSNITGENVKLLPVRHTSSSATSGSTSLLFVPSLCHPVWVSLPATGTSCRTCSLRAETLLLPPPPPSSSSPPHSESLVRGRKNSVYTAGPELSLNLSPLSLTPYLIFLVRTHKRVYTFTHIRVCVCSCTCVCMLLRHAEDTKEDKDSKRSKSRSMPSSYYRRPQSRSLVRFAHRQQPTFV